MCSGMEIIMRKKLSVSFVLLTIMTAAWMFTGCGDKGQNDTVSQTEEIDRTEQSSNAENDEERGKPDEESSDKSLETAEEQKPDKADEQSADNNVSDDESTSKTSDIPAGDVSDSSASTTEELEVVVESLGDHSILGNKIFIETGIDGNGEIAVVGSGGDNKTLVSVYFEDDVSFVYCIIKNGGADVETREGSFSDIKKGFILDMAGHYQDEIFWANKVEINDVRND